MVKNTHVKILLLQKNKTQRDICNLFSIDPGTLSKNISGERKTASIREKVADFLDMPYEEVWGPVDAPTE